MNAELTTVKQDTIAWATTLKADMGSSISMVNDSLTTTRSDLEAKMAGVGHHTKNIVAEAQDAFEKLRQEPMTLANTAGILNQECHAKFVTHEAEILARKAEIEDLYAKADSAVGGLKAQMVTVMARIEGIEVSGAGGGTQTGGKGKGSHGSYLPLKNRVPGTMTDDVMTWRKWRKDFLRFIDSETDGTKALLEIVENLLLEPTGKTKMDLDLAIDTSGKTWLKEERTKTHRALVGLTSGQANVIVESNKSEDGFVTWHQLATHFHGSAKILQDQLMMELGDVGKHVAKDMDDCKKWITELDNRKTKPRKQVARWAELIWQAFYDKSWTIRQESICTTSLASTGH